MPITGRFLADFSSFQDAVQKAEVSLRGMETGAGKVSTSLNKMVDSFSGRKLIQDATLAAEAVERIGGVTKLTEAELQKLAVQAGEAAAKLRAMGEDVPAKLQNLADQAKRSSGFFGELSDQVKSTALGFISAQAVIGGVQAAFHTLTAFVGSSVEAYSKAEAAAKKMTTALQAQGSATPAVIGHMNALAAEFQRTTVYSDDLITEMEALLVQVGNVAPGEMKKALAAATDLASGLGIDLQTATTLVGKAFEGETGTLKRYGIVIDEAKLKTQGITAVMDAIQSKFGGQAAAEIDTYAGRVKQLANEWDNFKEVVGETVVSSPLLEAGLRVIQERITGGTKAVEDHTHAWSDMLRRLDVFGENAPNVVARFVRSLEDMADASNKAAKSAMFSAEFIKPLVSHVDEATAAIQRFREEQKRQAEAAKAAAEAAKQAAEAAKQHAKAIHDLADALTGGNLTQKAKDLGEALALIQKQGDGTRETLQRIGDEASDLFIKGAQLSPQLLQLAIRFGALNLTVAEGVEGLSNLGIKLEAAILPMAELNRAVEDFANKLKLGADGMSSLGFKVETGFEKFTKKGAEAKDTLGELATAFSQLSQISGDSFGGVLKDIGSAIGMLNTVVKAVQTLQSVLANLRTTQAVAGAGASGSGGAGVFGGGAGGLVFGGLLTAALAIMAKDKKDEQEQALIDVTRGSVGTGLEQTYGGKANLERLSGQVGMDWRKIWDDSFIHNSIKGLQEFQNAVSALDQKLKALQADVEAYGLTWKDLSDPADMQAAFGATAQTLYDSFERLTMAGYTTDAVVKGMSGSLNQLIADAIDAGVKIPSGMQPVIEQLITMGQLTDDNARKLLGLGGGLAGGTFDEITEAAKRYGLTLDKLGPKVNQINIDKVGAQLSKDWKLLTSDGEDVNAVMKGMQKQVNEVVKAALHFGDTVPASMKPMLESMLKAGLLTDGAGHKLKDLTGITFAEPLAEKFDTLIEKLSLFIDAIIGPNGATGALGRLGRTRVDPIEIPYEYRQRGPGLPGGGKAGDGGGPRGGTAGPPTGGGTATGQPGGTGGTPPPGGGTATGEPGEGRTGSGPDDHKMSVPSGNTIIIEADGQTFASIVVPWLPGEVQRYRIGRP